MTTTTTTTREAITKAVAGMYRCRSCKATARVDFELSFVRVTTGWKSTTYDRRFTRNGVALPLALVGGEVPPVRCACGAWTYGRQIRARLSEHKCDARCTGARGHDCECSCNGANHGRDHLPHAG